MCRHIDQNYKKSSAQWMLDLQLDDMSKELDEHAPKKRKVIVKESEASSSVDGAAIADGPGVDNIAPSPVKIEESPVVDKCTIASRPVKIEDSPVVDKANTGPCEQQTGLGDPNNYKDPDVYYEGDYKYEFFPFDLLFQRTPTKNKGRSTPDLAVEYITDGENQTSVHAVVCKFDNGDLIPIKHITCGLYNEMKESNERRGRPVSGTEKKIYSWEKTQLVEPHQQFRIRQAADHHTLTALVRASDGKFVTSFRTDTFGNAEEAEAFLMEIADKFISGDLD